ncbi:uncharacterized protein [Medicago truncatula]|uniref:PIF1-like helicase n=1 Tax=Medicago truncatula TaxID=3880 RepID=G7I449_MEDTR|nr:uncharacterized protein LOC11408488 isoform X1 [Medicago truncatula]XP_024629306.1 uncharacterized protein LOC11408488 isoform X1 [Medicago truncatula]XP_024629311.1 uncharacterized protein LOC11408488 isoform X1 [Medicago truncatula]XP_024629313.1 uncharacterized protein LOC11408488 isoform X1 [Medicago truncatula]AES62030.1 PIF1-like helicase [Medicago truncatula]
MAGPFDTVKGVNTTKEEWKIGVRITDMWIVTNMNNHQHLEMVLMDTKGDKIQAIIVKDDIAKWGSILIEQKTYVMQNFKVLNNDLQIKLCDHPCKIIIHGRSVIYEHPFPDIPLTKVEFKTFSQVLTRKMSEPNDGYAEVDTSPGDPIDAIVQSTYPDLLSQYNNEQYLQSRAILTYTNEVVDQINDYVLKLIPGEGREYYSADRSKMNDVGAFDAIPPEFLNTIKTSDLPNHKFTLKIGTPVMLLKDLDLFEGFRNGTRLIVTRLGRFVLQAKSISGNNIGELVLIPRLDMSPSQSKLPFKLVRRQFPIVVSYAMTINKSQGHSFDNVGLYLPKPRFSNGQLCTTFSRVKSKQGLETLIHDKEKREMSSTTNLGGLRRGFLNL